MTTGGKRAREPKEVAAAFHRAGALLTLVALALGSALPARAALEPVARDRLRERLQRLYDESDLLVKNRKADRADRKRQEREASYLRLHERIPPEDRLDPLKTELGVSAELHQLDLIRFELIEKSELREPLPPAVAADAGFRLREDQLVQRIRFRLVARGERSHVERWVRHWGRDLVRLVEPEPGFGRPGIRPVPGRKHGWQVTAVAWRFRDVRFPRLVPRDPLAVLPDWARSDPERFAREEPRLWHLVQATRALVPEARPLFEERRAFLLEQARFEFFLRKSLASERQYADFEADRRLRGPRPVVEQAGKLPAGASAAR
jgi:hypothetical protein